MPEIPDVLPLETIEVQWGNAIRDRTAQRYVDQTERDNLNPVPVAGQLAYIQSTDQFQYFDGTDWIEVQSATDGPFLPLTGGNLTGLIRMGTNQIKDVLDPTEDQDAATKIYVDIAVTPPVPPFPVVEERAVWISGGNNAPHNVTMPAVTVAGDILVMIYGYDDGDETFTGEPPAGWTRFWGNPPIDVLVGTLVWGKVADGTEGGTTVLVTPNSTESACCVTYRVSNVSGTFPANIDVAGFAGPAAPPDPPNLIPSWGLASNLWIASFTLDLSNRTIGSYPLDYTDGIENTDGSTTFAVQGSAERLLAAASEDPGVFTIVGGDRSYQSVTVAVQGGPAAAVFNLLQNLDTRLQELEP